MTISPTTAPQETLTPAPLKGGGRRAPADTGFRWLSFLAGFLVLAVLVGIIISMTSKAWPAFSKMGFSYFTEEKIDQVNQIYGSKSYIYGTIVVSFLAVLFAVPISLGIALFVTEVAPQRLRWWITTIMDLLASVPSVVFGLWGFLILRPHLNDIYNSIHAHVESIPVLNTVFGPSGGGNSFMTAGLIVGLMITPIITSIAREVFATVPRNDKDGALALGATRWEMIRGVVLPHSSGGIVGAVMLGLGRAMGETIAIALVIGANPQIVSNLFATGEAMPSVIVRNLPESSGDFQAALIGLGVVLMALTVLVNIGAKLLVARIDRLRGA
ncbi:MAG TPA: phosphate ABC transporter permease subunit PstC [Acidimicrobiales bacterium]|jgi:phosphate transport system permease protein